MASKTGTRDLFGVMEIFHVFDLVMIYVCTLIKCVCVFVKYMCVYFILFLISIGYSNQKNIKYKLHFLEPLFGFVWYPLTSLLLLLYDLSITKGYTSSLLYLLSLLFQSSLAKLCDNRAPGEKYIKRDSKLILTLGDNLLKDLLSTGKMNLGKVKLAQSRKRKIQEQSVSILYEGGRSEGTLLVKRKLKGGIKCTSSVPEPSN